MTLLIYGIMRAGSQKRSGIPAGVGARPVVFSSHDDLAAAHSLLPGAVAPMTLADIQTFHNVIQWLCGRTTTVPLRYGSLFRDESALGRHLRSHGERFDELLLRIDGCVEMGLRIQGPVRQTATSEDNHPEPGRDPAGPGIDYLYRRRRHYADRDGHITSVNQIVSTYKGIFKGLFKDFTYDTISPPAKNQTGTTAPGLDLSLYFLVPQDHRPAFLSTLKTAESTSPHRLRLSGPWPPYNFVTGAVGQPSKHQDERHGLCP